MAIRLLAIGGSPRKGGNSWTLLGEAIQGARSRGAEVEVLNACELEIRPCAGCEGCRKTGSCTTLDVMQEVYPKLIGLDRLLVASPLYFMGVSAQLKILIDRCQPFWVRKELLGEPLEGRAGIPRRGAFIACSGGDKNFYGAVKTVRALFNVLSVEYSGELLLPGLEGPEEVRKLPEALRRARELGEALAA